MKRTRLMAMGLSLLMLVTYTAFAVEKPRSLATDKRIKVVTYQADNIVPIRGTTFITTQLIFGNHEKIIDVQGGDAAAWTINIDKYLPNVLNIKPTILGSKSNLSVITVDANGKRRYYHFALTSNKKPTINPSQQTYVIQFVYPNAQSAKVIAKLKNLKLTKHGIQNAYQHPKQYNWHYSFSGAPALKPLHVFDDGTLTYIQLRPHQVVPAIFAVRNKQGQESVVNYRRVGNTIVVQTVAPQLSLRDGKHTVASIFNNTLIAKRRHHG